MTRADPAVLQRLRLELAGLYGDRIERIVLFGSRARGDAREDSDYDVAVFLKDFRTADRWEEIDRIVEVTTDILLDTGAVISAIPFQAGAWQDRTPLMHEIRREGRDL